MERQTIEYNPNKWRAIEDSSERLAHIHADADGHVTVTCHCPRCEAERAQAEELAPLVLNEPAELREAERAESGYVVPLGSPIRPDEMRARDEADGRD